MSFSIQRSSRAAVFAAAACFMSVSATAVVADTPATAPTTQPDAAAPTFATPDAAVDALVAAARSQSGDDLQRVLGAAGKQVADSGDAVADQNARDRFCHAYDQQHQIVDHGTTKTLVVGNNQWPMPIPLAQTSNGQWYFDTATGRDDILDRRIGRDERATMQTMHAIVDAQQEYAMADPDHDGVPAYAERFKSTAGKKDGLYWPVTGDEKQSPLGPLFADAADEGYTSTTHPAVGPHKPYHGYYYRILKKQSSAATGGAMDYIIDGQMIGGFAVIAWPADFGNSGVMTFIINHQGVLYQRNLGTETPQAVKQIDAFDPTPQWTKCDTSTASTQP